MKHLIKVLIVSISISLIGCGGVPYSATRLPDNLMLNPELSLPSSVDLAIYIPDNFLSSAYRDPTTSEIIEYGQSMRQASIDVGSQFFQNILFTEQNLHKNYGLLLDIDPDWEIEGGKIILELDYRLLDSNQQVVHKGSQTFAERFDYYYLNKSFYNATVRASQMMYVDIMNTLQPTPNAYPSLAPIADVSPEVLVNMEKPIRRSTGFRLNADGEILTTAGVLEGCLVSKAVIGDSTYDLSPLDTSSLLDLSVLATYASFDSYLKFAENDGIDLGQSLVSVSFPFSGERKPAPLLTFGNVHSQEGITGSMGTFQVSAAVQPGAYGSAVLNQDSQVVGIVNGNLNLEYLAEADVISENVFFALKSKYIKKFLTDMELDHTTTSDAQGTNSTETALANAVQINCYQ